MQATMPMNEQQRQALARLKQLLDDPEAADLAIADSYVELLGSQLLLLSRQGFQRDGRGAIEIDLRGVDLRNATGGLPIAYYPVADAGDDWPAESGEAIAGYDPQRETVVILYHDHGEPLLYVLEAG